MVRATANVSPPNRCSMMTKPDPLVQQAPSITAVILERIDRRTIRRALGSGADALEIRVDGFARREPGLLQRDFERLRSYEESSGVPVILTCRDKGEGGLNAIGARQKRQIFRVLMPYVDYIDIELRKASLFGDIIGEAGRAGVGVIISYHDFRATPSTVKLEEIIHQALSHEGDIVKIAATARRRADLRRLTRLLVEERGPLIVIAMGPLGQASRVFFPLLGSLTTYGSVTKSTAPGQMSVAELAEAFASYGIRGQVRV